MREVTLSPSLFAILTRLVEERTGIHYAPGEHELFSGKLIARALEAGFESPLDYYYFLRYDDPDRREFDGLIDALVVNETYFFREADALRVLCDEILRPAIAAGGRPRVWCAAASTGEEPLTLAMLLAERDLLDNVEIVASDISTRALKRAKAGAYAGRSLRAITTASARGPILANGYARWFQPASKERDAYDIRGEVAGSITWQRVNLLDAQAVHELGVFDAIICRNVLIYFSEDTVREVVGRLSVSLREGGRLLVGASESLLRFGTMLACEERGGVFFYRKALLVGGDPQTRAGAPT